MAFFWGPRYSPAVEFKDYYKILGISRGASDDDIKKSFRKLARQYHPDVAKDKKDAEEKFKEINEAYEVLGDAATRRNYDLLGGGWNEVPQFRPPRGMEQPICPARGGLTGAWLGATLYVAALGIVFVARFRGGAWRRARI